MNTQVVVDGFESAMQKASNQKPIQEFVAFIKDQLEISTQSWHKIAGAFHEASEMYGLDSEAYKGLLQDTGFHKSKASKLLAIASSERLKRYEVQLSCVHSWTTLYEVTTLSDGQFANLCSEYDLDNVDARPCLTESKVRAFKQEKKACSPFKRFAFISIDEDALKGGVLDGSALEEVHEALKKIADLSPYIKLEETGIDETETALFYKQVDSRMRALTRTKLQGVINRKLNETTIQKRKGHSTEQHFLHVFGISRAELIGWVNEGDAKKAFAYFGVEDEYNQVKLWDEALGEVQLARRKFLARAIARANTADPIITAAAA
jgi:hypothetical protein